MSREPVFPVVDDDRIEAVRAALGVSLVRLYAEIAHRTRAEFKSLGRTEDFEAARQARCSLRVALGLGPASPELAPYRSNDLATTSKKKSVERMIDRWIAADIDSVLAAVSLRTIPGSGGPLLLGNVMTYQTLGRWGRPPWSEVCPPPTESTLAAARFAIAAALGISAPHALSLDPKADREVERLLAEYPARLRIEVSAVADPRRPGS